MSLSFVPRKVARPGSAAKPVVASTVAQSILDLHHVDSNEKGKEREKQHVSSEDYAALLHLSLSEYTLWFDSDLSRRVTSPDTEGFLPLSYLFEHSHFLSGLKPVPPEAVIVKAIRAHLDDVFEMRILVSSPLKSNWHSQGSSFSRKEENLGGYEIRRRNWRAFGVKMSEHNKRDWDAKTIYVEKLPPQLWSIPAICRLVGSLLGDPSSFLEVQNITLPPHHMDRSEALPKPRGFAFITLLSLQSVEFLLGSWPWMRQNVNSNGISFPAAQEALKFGFRTISKSQWEELKEEYLSYREQLLEGIAASEESNAIHPSLPPASMASPPLHTHPSSSYPFGCLIFVRNIHPETNKTTLRTLFTSVIGQGQESLDYVDFNKGMDSCFLRVANSKCGQMLVEHFAAHPVTQLTGLDSIGAPLTSPVGKAIAMEFVVGKREELYWNKVPEKVRRQAVGKASQIGREEVDEGCVGKPGWSDRQHAVTST